MNQTRYSLLDFFVPKARPAEAFGSLGQSYFMPLSATTFDQRSASVLMKAANSAGVLVAGNSPAASALALMAGSASTFATCCCSLPTIAAGVPLGATRPSQT